MGVLRLRRLAAPRAGALPPVAGWAVLTGGTVLAVFPTLCEARWFATESSGQDRAEICALPFDPAQ